MQCHTDIEDNEIADGLAKKGVYLGREAAANLSVIFKEAKKKQGVLLFRQASILGVQAKGCSYI